MIILQIKALSVNQVRQWKRFKTNKYKEYEKLIMLMLPKNMLVPKWKIEIFFQFWVSSKNSDRDNMIKPLQDIISKKYWFNDKKIYRWIVEKVDVKKWKEFIKIYFREYDESKQIFR